METRIVEIDANKFTKDRCTVMWARIDSNDRLLSLEIKSSLDDSCTFLYTANPNKKSFASKILRGDLDSLYTQIILYTISGDLVTKPDTFISLKSSKSIRSKLYFRNILLNRNRCDMNIFKPYIHLSVHFFPYPNEASL